MPPPWPGIASVDELTAGDLTKFLASPHDIEATLSGDPFMFDTIEEVRRFDPQWMLSEGLLPRE